MFSRAASAASALLALAAVGSAQGRSPVDLKIGLSQGDSLGAYAGLDYRLPNLPFRIDLDGYSAFEDFGDRSSGVELTLVYVRPLVLKGYSGLYAGVGAGYIKGSERGDDFDSFGTKLVFGGRMPGTKFGIEGSLLWAQHSIGQIHTVGTASLVYRF